MNRQLRIQWRRLHRPSAEAMRQRRIYRHRRLLAIASAEALASLIGLSTAIAMSRLMSHYVEGLMRLEAERRDFDRRFARFKNFTN